MNSLKLYNGIKVSIKELDRYRFSTAEVGSGKHGTVLNAVLQQQAVQIEIDNDIFWYDLSEIQIE